MTGKDRRYLQGLEVMVFILLLSLTVSQVAAQESPALPSFRNLSTDTDTGFSPVLVQDGKPVVYFFFNHNCGECLKTLPFIEEFDAAHPDVMVFYVDVMESDENLALFKAFKDYYGASFVPVPSVFVGNITLSGTEEITGGLGEAVNGTLSALPTPAPSSRLPEGAELTLPLVIASALVDGINPCAFSVLIFLLVTIVSLESRRKMLAVGSVFICAVFTFYFLSGLGLFAVIQSAGISRLISIIAAIVALAAGVISVLSVFGQGNGQSILSIPESKKGIINRYITKASIPAAFIVGLLVGMFELPCTGGIYLAILSLLSTRMTAMEGIPYLLVYNFFFVLPLIVILGICTYGLPVERLEEWRIGSRKAVRVIMGALMIFLGIILLLEII
jgi:cytochrome c biogenesis protein CcdA/glutaredoxin-related protein